MLRENIILAKVHSVGEKDVWLTIEGKMYSVKLPAERINDVQHFLFQQLMDKQEDEEWLLPIDLETQEIYIYEQVDVFVSEELRTLIQESKERSNSK